MFGDKMEKIIDTNVHEFAALLQYIVANCWLCTQRKKWSISFKGPYNRCDICSKIMYFLEQKGFLDPIN